MSDVKWPKPGDLVMIRVVGQVQPYDWEAGELVKVELSHVMQHKYPSECEILHDLDDVIRDFAIEISPAVGTGDESA